MPNLSFIDIIITTTTTVLLLFSFLCLFRQTAMATEKINLARWTAVRYQCMTTYTVLKQKHVLHGDNPVANVQTKSKSDYNAKCWQITPNLKSCWPVLCDLGDSGCWGLWWYRTWVGCSLEQVGTMTLGCPGRCTIAPDRLDTEHLGDR